MKQKFNKKNKPNISMVKVASMIIIIKTVMIINTITSKIIVMGMVMIMISKSMDINMNIMRA